MPKPTRRMARRATVDKELATALDAAHLKHHDPATRRRFMVWREQLSRDYPVRRARDGDEAARQWLIAELRAAKLPDLRHPRGLDDAAQRKLAMYEDLLPGIEAVYRRYIPGSLRTRAAHDAAKEVLGVRPKTDPIASTPAAYCYDVLDTDAVTLSRLRSRGVREARKHLADVITLLSAIQTGRTVRATPEDRRRATAALKILRSGLRRVPRYRDLVE